MALIGTGVNPLVILRASSDMRVERACQCVIVACFAPKVACLGRVRPFRVVLCGQFFYCVPYRERD